MKFYEFNDFEYYALICANTKEEAVKYYSEVVANIENGDGEPDEISKEKTITKIMMGYNKIYNNGLNIFNEIVSDGETSILLLDGNLI